jgi:hypothetical protein
MCYGFFLSIHFLGMLFVQVERDLTPLYHAAKELIKMQMESGEFPQQVCFSSLEG